MIKKLTEKEREEYFEALSEVYKVFTTEALKENIKIIKEVDNQNYHFTGFCDYLQKLVNWGIIKMCTYYTFLEYLVINPPAFNEPEFIHYGDKVIGIKNFLFPEGEISQRRRWLITQLVLLDKIEPVDKKELRITDESDYLDTLEKVYDQFTPEALEKNIKMIEKKTRMTYEFSGFCNYLANLIGLKIIKQETYSKFLTYLAKYPPENSDPEYEVFKGEVTTINNYLFQVTNIDKRRQWLMRRIIKLNNNKDEKCNK